MRLPRVEGQNLNRKKRVFPDDFGGEINLVFIAFLRWHQELIDEWVPFVAQLAEEFPELRYYEFPTLARRGFFYRTFLNEGMRAGIPNPATRERTITLYLNKRAFRSALEIEDEGNIWLYLFDRLGNVLWRVEGRFSAEKGAALRDIVRQQGA
ncbi:MAG: hypothetical protein PVH18_14005 [Chloroflexota bacterium]|jgi:hypothetical protein